MDLPQLFKPTSQLFKPMFHCLDQCMSKFQSWAHISQSKSILYTKAKDISLPNFLSFLQVDRCISNGENMSESLGGNF